MIVCIKGQRIKKKKKKVKENLALEYFMQQIRRFYKDVDETIDFQKESMVILQNLNANYQM